MLSYSTPEDSDCIPNLRSPLSQGSLKTPGWATGCFSKGYKDIHRFLLNPLAWTANREALSKLNHFFPKSQPVGANTNVLESYFEVEQSEDTEEQGVFMLGALWARVDINLDVAMSNPVNRVSYGEEEL